MPTPVEWLPETPAKSKAASSRPTTEDRFGKERTRGEGAKPNPVPICLREEGKFSLRLYPPVRVAASSKRYKLNDPLDFPPCHIVDWSEPIPIQQIHPSTFPNKISLAFVFQPEIRIRINAPGRDDECRGFASANFSGCHHSIALFLFSSSPPDRSIPSSGYAYPCFYSGNAFCL